MIIAEKGSLLTKRTGQEWLDLITKIEDPVLRKNVASIVWYDFFGNQLVSERWPHLDNILNIKWPWPSSIVPYVAFSEAAKDKVLRELIAIGYPEDRAKRRLNIKFPTPVNKRGYDSSRVRHRQQSNKKCLPYQGKQA
jgi:hypothetical protein